MLHYDSASGTDARASAGRTAGKTINVIAYRSRAVSDEVLTDLDDILSAAQKRNRAEGVTGILIYDRGYFFQWIEGPIAGLNRIWNSILRDPRHGEIKLLREDAVEDRFFDSWDMRLARSKRRVHAMNAEVNAPDQLLTQLFGRPSVLADGPWNRLFAESVIPQLKALHTVPVVARTPPRNGYSQSPLATNPGSGVIGGAHAGWLASPDCGERLAHMLLRDQSERIDRYIDGLLVDGASLGGLCTSVFEPAERILGELWCDDRCCDFELTVALARLQMEVRRIGADFVREPVEGRPARTVLMLPQPGEPHGVGISMASELFYRDGWDVTCEFPGTVRRVCDLVQERWFDVLELSSSGALRRDYLLPVMRETISAVHAASLNPALAVIVDGRTFYELPRAYRDIAADAGCATAVDGVQAAARLLDRNPLAS